jgi:hypothetical protein
VTAGLPGNPVNFMKCRKPDCLRKIPPGILYCCHSCGTAAQAPAPYEIEPYDPAAHWVLVHSEGCEQRSRERGECDRYEAVTLEQR